MYVNVCGYGRYIATAYIGYLFIMSLAPQKL